MSPRVLLAWMGRILLAPVMAVGFALLVRGYSEGGGGFAAGLVGGLAVVVHLVGNGREEALRRMPWIRMAPLVIVLGLGLMAGVSFLPLLAGQAALTHHPGPGESLVRLGSLELHTSLAFELGMAMLTFGFMAGVLDMLTRERS